MAQDAIDKAEKGDYSEVNKLLEELKSPFDDKEPTFCQLPPSWGLDICVTCSS